MHIQLDHAVSNAEKNKWIPVEKQSERMLQSSRSRNGRVRFTEAGASPNETAYRSHAARMLLHSKGQSNQVLAYTKRYRESLHSKSGNQHVGEFDSGKANDFTKGIHVEWRRLCESVTQNPHPVLADMVEDTMQSIGQFLSFRQ